MTPGRVSWWIVVLALAASAPAGAQDRSPIVLNCDGNGTTIVKPFAGSSFQVQQLWTDNSVNGIQAFDDGTFAFVNCAQVARRLDEIDLSCRVYDDVLGRWSDEPIPTTVGNDFLNGDFENPYDSLFGVTGEYLTIFEVGGEAHTLRVRFLDGIFTVQDFPILLGETSPPTDQS